MVAVLEPTSTNRASEADTGKVKFDYGSEPVQYWRSSSPRKCWPQPGEAAVQDAVRFVRPQVKEWLEDPAKCLLLKKA